MGFQEILVILIVAMIAIGPVKIIDFGKKLGKYSRTIEQTSKRVMSDLNSELEEENKPAKQPAEKS